MIMEHIYEYYSVSNHCSRSVYLAMIMVFLTTAVYGGLHAIVYLSMEHTNSVSIATAVNFATHV